MKRKSLYFKDHPYNLYQSVENSPFPLPTNSKGLIGKQEFNLKKDPNTTRILVLGSSPIERLPPRKENKKHDPNKTVTHFLEKELNKLSKNKNLNKKFEVLNLSSSGYTSYECLISFICKGRFFYPDLVISYQGVNDVIWSVIADGFSKDYSHARKNNFYKQRCFINDLLCSLPDSKFLDILDKYLIKFKLKKPNGLIFSIAKENLKIDKEFSVKKLDVLINNLEMLNSISNLYGSKLLNLTFVWNPQKPLNPSHIYKELESQEKKNLFNLFYNKYLEEINHLITSNKKLKTFKLPIKYFDDSAFCDGVHFSLKGMKIFAKLTAEYLMNNRKNLFL